MSAIAKAIREAALRGSEIYLKLCTVDSVDENKRTIVCTPADGTAQLTGVSLQSVTGESGGLLVVPKAGSFVTVGFLDKNNAVVLLYSQIEKITLSVADKVSIKNPSYSLADAFKDLISALGKLTVTTGVGPSGTPVNVAEFQQIQQKLNNFLE